MTEAADDARDGAPRGSTTLLVEDSRVAPYCPRCQTALSDHEVSLGYHDVVDPSVYVRLPVAFRTDWAGRSLRRGH